MGENKDFPGKEAFKETGRRKQALTFDPAAASPRPSAEKTGAPFKHSELRGPGCDSRCRRDRRPQQQKKQPNSPLPAEIAHYQKRARGTPRLYSAVS